jgi:hypothetical protein
VRTCYPSLSRSLTCCTRWTDVAAAYSCAPTGLRQPDPVIQSALTVRRRETSGTCSSLTPQLRVKYSMRGAPLGRGRRGTAEGILKAHQGPKQKAEGSEWLQGQLCPSVARVLTTVSSRCCVRVQPERRLICHALTERSLAWWVKVNSLGAPELRAVLA